MKIVGVETFIAGNPWKNWLFAKVLTDEGLYGIGEGTLNYFGRTVETAIHELKPLILGMDPFQIEILYQKLVRDVYSEGAQIHMCAVAAIEIACWDIIGKACNQPVYNLMGGRCHQRLRAYANGWYRGPRTPESFAEKAKAVAARGYTALKFDPFGDAWRVLPRREFDLSLDIIRAVRDAVGDPVDILIEGHCRFNVATAIEFSEAMHGLRPMWFEEPVPHTNIAAMVEVARRSPVPVATGESLSTKQQYAELLKQEAVSILQPEPLNLGGLFTTRKIAGMVDAHFGMIAPHSAQGPVCSAACAQLNASLPNFLIHEVFDEFNEPWEKDIVVNGVEVVDGYIEIPERPGLGIDLNIEEILKHPYQQENALPLFKPGWERRQKQGMS
ncbi:MAG: mandelate racemase/muconate lactonizing enzyme family protein [Bryobacteraceae bacterium]|nr:mandelate racemase/muconate lactonizing enzyme family protein [Bryobacterales bacterium]MEB2360795.1 mandelate racemase/muconate lactonizing enzyme family protein [Bryobacterales bacterium]NUN02917.1 mandelate racemase/muconate lactonizing enzyme family protein [Bryobacteraceae bacterium]